MEVTEGLAQEPGLGQEVQQEEQPQMVLTVQQGPQGLLVAAAEVGAGQTMQALETLDRTHLG